MLQRAVINRAQSPDELTDQKKVPTKGTFFHQVHFAQKCAKRDRDKFSVMNDKPRQRPLEDDASDVRIDGFDANGEIGSKLKAFYSSVQEEPIPDKFLELLEKLDATERSVGVSAGREGRNG